MRRTNQRRASFELLASLVVGQGAPPSDDWGSEVLWRRLLPLAELHRVTAFLPGGIQTIGEWQNVPEDVAQFLQAVKKLNVKRNQGLSEQCLNIITTLQKVKIRAVPLKGLAYQLMGLHGDDPGQRMTIDIDMLVPLGDAEKAQETLISGGYTPLNDHAVSTAEHHNLARLKPDPDVHGPGSIEVHFRVGRNETDLLLPAQRVLKTAEAFEVSGRQVLLPNLLDLLDHAVLHSGISHSYASRRTLRLRDVVDISRLWALAQSRGVEISDLRISEHKLARRYFGACLLLHGHPIEALGPLGPPSAEFLAQILRRQSIAERPKLETAILSNIQLLARNPSRLGAKLLRGSFYRSAKTLAKSPNV